MSGLPSSAAPFPWAREQNHAFEELLDSLDIFRKITGLRLQDVYNLMLRKGWTLGSPQLMRVMHGVIRLYHGPTVRLLEKFWAIDRPDLVVSVVPNFNRAMGQSLRQALPSVPLVTILTDFADYPPHFWIERQPQYFICGTDRAVGQARAMGHDDAHVFRTSGMILAPKFYEAVELDRRAERQKLGLDPDLLAGLVLFGGHGSRVMRWPIRTPARPITRRRRREEASPSSQRQWRSPGAPSRWCLPSRRIRGSSCWR